MLGHKSRLHVKLVSRDGPRLQHIIGAQAFKYFGFEDDLATPFYAIAVLVGAAGFLSLILVIEQPADLNMTVEKTSEKE